MFKSVSSTLSHNHSKSNRNIYLVPDSENGTANLNIPSITITTLQDQNEMQEMRNIDIIE